MSETTDLLKELVKLIDGDEMKLGSPECVTFKNTHENCFGCPTEIRCARYITLQLVCLCREDKQYEFHDRIREATTLEELNKIADETANWTNLENF